MKSALFPRFGENLRPMWRFWQLWRLKMRFGQNVLRMTWKARFVQFSWKAHCFPVSKRISGQCDDFDNFDAQKCDLAKTCCAWPEKSVLYNFHKKRTLFPFWRAFQASVTILKTLMLTNAIWPKRAAHDMKRAFCTIFMESELLARSEKNLRPVWRFWELWRSKMRFGQNVLRMTWNERFVQFSWKANCFARSEENFRPVWRFWELWRSKMRFGQNVLRMTWAFCENDEKRNVSPFCTIFMKSAMFPRFGENLRPVWRFWQLRRSKMRFGQNVLRMTWKERFVQFFMERALFSRFDELFRPV